MGDSEGKSLTEEEMGDSQGKRCVTHRECVTEEEMGDSQGECNRGDG